MVKQQPSMAKLESTIKVGEFLIFSTGKVYDERKGRFLEQIAKDSTIGYEINGKFVSISTLMELFQ